MCQLIEPGKPYYHKRLRILPPVPTSYIDADGLIHQNPVETWDAITMIPTFELNDLFVYYCNAFDIKLTHHDDIKQHKNSLKYLVGRFGLDEILFAIDYYCDMVHMDDALAPRNPLELQKFIHEAIEILELKKANEAGEGICSCPPM